MCSRPDFQSYTLQLPVILVRSMAVQLVWEIELPVKVLQTDKKG